MGNASSTGSTEASSGVSVDERRLRWKIENFDVMRNSETLMQNQELEFNAGVTIGLPTKWACCLKVFTEARTKWIGVILKLLNKPETAEEVNVSFEIIIKKDNKGGIFFQNKVPVVDMAKASSAIDIGFKRVVSCDAKVKDLPLINEALEIELVFKLFAPKPRQLLNSDLPNKLEIFKLRATEKLIKDLGQNEILTGPKTDSATKIVSKDNTIFPVNRGLLSVRSKVFERMFQSGMQEAQTGIVNMDDLSSKTIKVMLEYLTTATLHKDWQNPEVIEELCLGAHRYELALLVELLDDVLGTVCKGNYVNVKKAVRLANLAKTLGMKKAEADLIVYIKENGSNAEDFTFNITADNE